MNSNLTIIVPLYNQEKYIRQCLESILHQSLTDIEVIVVNDGSTDKSLEICKSIAATDDRLKIISQNNEGPTGARYTGIMNVSTKYVTFVDADDFILPDAYKNAIEAMENGVDMILFEISRYFSDSNIKTEYHSILPGYYDLNRLETEVFPKLIWDFERGTPGIECSQCVRIVKRDMLIEQYHRLNGRKFYYGEDVAITYPLTFCIQSMEVIPKSYYLHRQRTNGAPPYIKSKKYFDEAFNLYKYLMDQLSEYRERYGLNKQIEYFFVYSVNLKKMVYNDYEYSKNFIFPFNKVPYWQNIVLYGAGEVGKTYYGQLMKLQYAKNILWIDINALSIGDDRVRCISEIETFAYDYVIIAIENRRICEQVKERLLSLGISEIKIVI